jgi:prepilin-type N-terminal cleavage/methylation domain-containing protein
MVMQENKGVTLIELMIALVISVILVGGTYSIFVSQQQTYIVQDQVVGAQQDGRAAVTIMAKDIRMAGMLTGVDGFSVYGATEAMTPTNSSTSPDQVRVVYAAEEFTSGGSSVTVTGVNGSQVTLSQPIGTFFNSGGTPNRSYVAFEGVNHVYVISSVAGSILNLSEPPSGNLATFNARVLRVRAVTYSVSGTTLQRNDGDGAQTLAGATNQCQVEDLQIAYQFAGDTTHWYNTTPAGFTNKDIRAVRINLLVRTPVEDTNDRNYTRPSLEDHAGSATNDGFRRRVYTTVVMPRNF